MSEKKNYLRQEYVPDHETMVDNVLAVYDAATNHDIIDGTSWYPDALAFAASLADLTGIKTSQAAAIIAITSAETGWSANGNAAMRAIQHYRNHGATKQKPSFIMYGEMWRSIIRVLEGDEVVTGIKRSQFYRNILGDTQGVTIDRHAMRIAAGGGNWDSCADGTFKRIAAAYRDAADKRDIDPRDMQAITWTAYRRVRESRGGRTLAELYGEN